LVEEAFNDGVGCVKLVMPFWHAYNSIKLAVTPVSAIKIFFLFIIVV
jgi:hypothetical protein